MHGGAAAAAGTAAAASSTRARGVAVNGTRRDGFVQRVALAVVQAVVVFAVVVAYMQHARGARDLQGLHLEARHQELVHEDDAAVDARGGQELHVAAPRAGACVERRDNKIKQAWRTVIYGQVCQQDVLSILRQYDSASPKMKPAKSSLWVGRDAR